MPFEYTPAEKLAGKDLYGLPCRIPEPTPEQAGCTHTREVWEDETEEDWDGNITTTSHLVEHSTMQDIPGTHILQCSICGYKRRY